MIIAGVLLFTVFIFIFFYFLVKPKPRDKGKLAMIVTLVAWTSFFEDLAVLVV